MKTRFDNATPGPHQLPNDFPALLAVACELAAAATKLLDCKSTTSCVCEIVLGQKLAKFHSIVDPKPGEG